MEPELIGILIVVVLVGVCAGLLVMVLAQLGTLRSLQRQLAERQAEGQQAALQNRESVVRMEARLDEQVKAFANLRTELSDRSREGAESLAAFTEKQGVAANELRSGLFEQLADGRTAQQRGLTELRDQIKTELAEARTRFEQRQADATKALQEALATGQEAAAKRVVETLGRNAEEIGKRLESLTGKTDERLKEISGQVDKRLAEGFAKTTETFGDVLKRLALIDKAQEEITKLSTNVVSLQHVLSDKKSRGAFGEVQLEGLVRDTLPPDAYAFQHQLSNGNRADCVLFLPQPTGHVAVDSKFPLESYQRMTDLTLPESERTAAERQFKTDIKKHVSDISERYIIHNETGDGAIMFIPAESVFAEIHAHHRDLVEAAIRARVWITSPTTLMALLHTAQSVLKDEATRRQVHLIREHLVKLGQDFDRFQVRLDKLANNVRLAHENAESVATSARKLTSRFNKIEKAQLDPLEDAPEGEAETGAPELPLGSAANGDDA